jgi:hypothetical protein
MPNSSPEERTMPQTPPASFFNPTPSADFLAGVAVGRNMQLARGIAAAYAFPLGAALGARALLASTFAVAAARIEDNRPCRCSPEWTASLKGDGKGAVDLGDGYRLELNEANSEITIINERTCERTCIWGDPHVDGTNGQRLFDFWGTTTFTLENGTKITINTEQWKGNPDMYVASQVVITKGSNALVVNGISQNELGDLSITQSQNGRAIDAATPDGFTLRENAIGEGWRSVYTGAVATQADLDATKPGAAFGPGTNVPDARPWDTAFSLAISNFLLTGALGLLLGAAYTAGVEDGARLSLGARAAVRG